METMTESMFIRLHGGNGGELDLDFELGPVHSLGLGEGIAVHRPLGELHRESLVMLARSEYRLLDSDAEVDDLNETVVLDDGDLRWCFGGGQDLLFTVVNTPVGEYVRAMRECGSGWTIAADRLVVHQDAVGTARAIWQLVALLTY